MATVGSRHMAAAIVAAVTMITFLPVLRNDFHFDDFPNLVQNTAWRGLGWTELQWMFTTLFRGHFRPLTWFSLAIDYLIWDLDPFGYHLTSIAIHAVNAALFYFLAQRLLALAFPEEDEGGWRLVIASAFAALFFAIHPLRVEVLSSVTNRKELLATFFFLLAIWFYLQGRIKPAVVFYFLSLMSKAVALALPVALFILDRYPLRKAGLHLRNKIPFLVLAVPFGVVALLARGEEWQPGLQEKYSVVDRLAQGLYSPGWHVARLLLLEEPTPYFEGTLFSAVIILWTLMISVAAYLVRKKYPAVLACWLFSVVMLGPVLGIAQRAPMITSDRYSYLPALSWAILAGGLLLSALRVCPVQVRSQRRRRQSAELTPRARNALIAAATVLLISIPLVWRQARHWQTIETLLRHYIEARPKDARPSFILAEILTHQGRHDEAIAPLRRAVQIAPRFSEARHNLAMVHADLGKVLSRMGKDAAAGVHFQEAMRLDPNLPFCAVNFCQ